MDAIISKKLEEFFSSYPLRKFPKNQILVYAGESPEAVMYLETGRVRQYDISYRGDEVVVNIFQPPSFFPMSWAINGGNNRYFFEAMTDVEIRQAPPDQVLQFLRDNPEAMLNLLSRLYSGVDGILRRMAHLMGGSAKSRLIFEILTEGKRFGVERPDGACHVEVNESELASRTGMSRETVSRQMSALKQQQILEVSRSGLVLKDMAGLENLLGNNL